MNSRSDDDARNCPVDSSTQHLTQTLPNFEVSVGPDRVSRQTANFPGGSEQATEQDLAPPRLVEATGRFICDSNGRELRLVTGNIVLFAGTRLRENPVQEPARGQVLWSCPT